MNNFTYTRKNIYTIIENKHTFREPQGDPQQLSFIGYMDVFDIVDDFPQEDKDFINRWSDGYEEHELSFMYNIKISSIYKRKQRLVNKILYLLN